MFSVTMVFMKNSVIGTDGVEIVPRQAVAWNRAAYRELAERLSGGHLCEIRHDPIDVTMDGSLGGWGDLNRVLAPGLPRYFVDKREVSEAEYQVFLETIGAANR